MRLVSEIQQHLKEAYGPKHYYTTDYCQHERGYWSHIPGWLSQLKGGAVLDIGAAYGTLACLCSSGGFRVATLDRLPLLSPSVAADYGVTVFSGDVEREFIRIRHSADVVIMTEVLEHFNFHPLPTMIRIHTQMKQGGMLFLSTPDAESWGRVKRYPSLNQIPKFHRGLMDFNNPPWIDAHIWQYSLDELEDLLETTGFQVVHWKYSESAGGRHFNVQARAL